jgi:hypothetical protein
MGDHTTLHFIAPASGQAEVRLLNASGIEIRKLASGRFSAGSHQLNLETAGLASGIYFIEIRQAGHSQVLKAVKE